MTGSITSFRVEHGKSKGWHHDLMSTSTYLQRYAIPKRWIGSPPDENLGIVVVIPSFNEDTLLPALESLKSCKKTKYGVEVIVVFNEPENATERVSKVNAACLRQTEEWIKKQGGKGIEYHTIYARNLPVKDHGVGLARKIGMDEALRRIDDVENVKKGIIVSFDADSTCSENYLSAIEDHFDENPHYNGASIYFEHDLDKIKDSRTRSGIIQYELHLRYYIHAQRFTGFRYAFHAVGSSMAIKAEAYSKQGGMNKRKAGEDFYFLQKLVKLGNYSELNTTTVAPSPRASDRVPFGTGRAMTEWLKDKKTVLKTYNPRSFLQIKQLFEELPHIYDDPTSLSQLPDVVIQFLTMESIETVLEEAQSGTTNYQNFEKRFFSWFNTFKMMKYVHFCRDHHYPNIPVREAAAWLLKTGYGRDIVSHDPESLLKEFRSIDKERSEELI